MSSTLTATDRIAGFWVALATPLDAAGEIDHAAMAQHGRSLLERGCDGLVLFGTTGEGPSFAASERLAAVEALLHAGIPAGALALGTGFPSVVDSIALTRQALALGLVHALILPPYFFRDAPADGITDAFAAILDGVGDARLRATLYNIPQTSGVAVPPATAAVLRERYGVMLAGVKDSTGSFPSFLAFRAAAPEVAVTVGNEADIARALAAGGAGTICGMGNVAPGLVRAMFSGAAGEPAMRQAIDLMTGTFVPTLKSILAAQSRQDGWASVRTPLRAADPAIGARIAAALEKLQRANDETAA